MMRKMVDYTSYDSPYILVGKQGGDNSPAIEDTLRNLRADIRSCKVDNDRLVEAQEILVKAHENKVEVNATIFHRL